MAKKRRQTFIENAETESIFHHLLRAFIKINETIFLEDESPTLIVINLKQGLKYMVYVYFKPVQLHSKYQTLALFEMT